MNEHLNSKTPNRLLSPKRATQRTISPKKKRSPIGTKEKEKEDAKLLNSPNQITIFNSDLNIFESMPKTSMAMPVATPKTKVVVCTIKPQDITKENSTGLVQSKIVVKKR